MNQSKVGKMAHVAELKHPHLLKPCICSLPPKGPWLSVICDPAEKQSRLKGQEWVRLHAKLVVFTEVEGHDTWRGWTSLGMHWCIIQAPTMQCCCHDQVGMTYALIRTGKTCHGVRRFMLTLQ